MPFITIFCFKELRVQFREHVHVGIVNKFSFPVSPFFPFRERFYFVISRFSLSRRSLVRDILRKIIRPDGYENIKRQICRNNIY